ncbi:MAG TPA: HEAT repeat domain-containing protein [Candidatus Acidoferrales bacterium]|nr:HEAT repeat domain-containing protein [Candidatus Acidoferrales bacterium]
MPQAGMEQTKGPACEEFEPRLMLFVAGELDASEIADVNEHLQHCPGCNLAVAQEQEMLALLASRHTEPDAALLASCRAGLEDRLDQQEERGWLRRTIGALLPASWISPQPAWSAALLVLIGFSVGMLGPRLLRNSAGKVDTNSSVAATGVVPGVVTAAPASASSPSAGLSSLDMRTASVAGINVFPAEDNQPPQVQLQLNARQPYTVRGTVNDDDVKQMLMYILHNNQRFDPDVRLDAVDVLRMRNNDPDVRSALCQAVHTDHNAAVRLKALEALNGAEPQDIIRQTLLDALVDDQNPGVRVEAINALRDMAAKGQVDADDHLLAVLHERMAKDPNTYIRLQSAEVIRDLGPRQKF